jgi:hypothetical protein
VEKFQIGFSIEVHLNLVLEWVKRVEVYKSLRINFYILRGSGSVIRVLKVLMNF